MLDVLLVPITEKIRQACNVLEGQAARHLTVRNALSPRMRQPLKTKVLAMVRAQKRYLFFLSSKSIRE